MHVDKLVALAEKVVVNLWITRRPRSAGRHDRPLHRGVWAGAGAVLTALLATSQWLVPAEKVILL